MNNLGKMKSTVSILGVDPSLRNTGMAIVTYDKVLPVTDPNAFKVTAAQVISNPPKFTGTDAILNMLDCIVDESYEECYSLVDQVLIESPPIMFNKQFSSGTVSSIAHVAGGCIVAFGIEKVHIFRPSEWNKGRKKDATHAETVAFLGDPSTWDYMKKVKSEKLMEHILDAVSLALWWIKGNEIDG